jgi:hypothetical protein
MPINTSVEMILVRVVQAKSISNVMVS